MRPCLSLRRALLRPVWRIRCHSVASLDLFLPDESRLTCSVYNVTTFRPSSWVWKQSTHTWLCPNPQFDNSRSRWCKKCDARCREHTRIFQLKSAPGSRLLLTTDRAEELSKQQPVCHRICNQLLLNQLWCDMSSNCPSE